MGITIKPFKALRFFFLGLVFGSLVSLSNATCNDLGGQTNCDNSLTVGAKFGIGTYAPSAQIDNRILTAATTGQLTQATTGQTADMQQWVDSNTVVQSGVDFSGKFFGNGSRLTNITIAAGSTNYIQNSTTLQSGSTAYPQFVYAGSSVSAPAIASPNGSFITITGSSVTFSGSGSTITIKGILDLDGELKVNGLGSGTSGQMLLNGGSTKPPFFGGPRLLQKVHGTVVFATTATITTSFAKSGILVSITPFFTTSTVTVRINLGRVTNTVAGDNIYTSLFRNGTNLAGSSTRAMSISGTSLTITEIASASYIKDDSPNTTSAVTYEVYFYADAGSASLCSSTAECWVDADEWGP